jgi:hypothetical protein
MLYEFHRLANKYKEVLVITSVLMSNVRSKILDLSQKFRVWSPVSVYWIPRSLLFPDQF